MIPQNPAAALKQKNLLNPFKHSTEICCYFVGVSSDSSTEIEKPKKDSKTLNTSKPLVKLLKLPIMSKSSNSCDMSKKMRKSLSNFCFKVHLVLKIAQGAVRERRLERFKGCHRTSKRRFSWTPPSKTFKEKPISVCSRRCMLYENWKTHQECGTKREKKKKTFEMALQRSLMASRSFRQDTRNNLSLGYSTSFRWVV